MPNTFNDHNPSLVKLNLLMPPIVKLILQLCVCISWPSFSSYQGNWAKFTIDNWVAESADAAAAEQAAQFGGIAFPVKYLEPLSWSCAVRLWWPLGACKPNAGSSAMCSVQNVQFCHFLGAWCWDLTMPLHILLLCNDLAYSITLKWIVTCAFYRIFIAWHCTAI